MGYEVYINTFKNMGIDILSLNWIAIIISIIVGQVISTVWFTVLFGDPWAREYGVEDKKQHTAEIPLYTYGVGLISMIVLTLGIAILQKITSIQSVFGALGLALFIIIGFSVATGLPGHAFLKRWRAFILMYGSQAVIIVAISLILALWG